METTQIKLASLLFIAYCNILKYNQGYCIVQNKCFNIVL
jgi:hypothetical protein